MLENTIFPEDQIAQSDGIDLPARYIDAALEERGHQPAVFRGSITLALVACIDYQFSFAPGHHQTRYAFWVGVPGPSGWWNGNIKPEGVPAGIALRLSGQSAD
jgi:hypothetical protein